MAAIKKNMSLEEYINHLYGIYISNGKDREYTDLYIITRGNAHLLDKKYVLDEALVDDIVLTLRDRINGLI